MENKHLKPTKSKSTALEVSKETALSYTILNN